MLKLLWLTFLELTSDTDRMKTVEKLLMDLGAITQTGAVTREGG